MSTGLIFALCGLIGMVYIVWKLPIAAVLLVVAGVGLTATGYLNIETKDTDKLKTEAKENLDKTKKNVSKEAKETKDEYIQRQIREEKAKQKEEAKERAKIRKEERQKLLKEMKTTK